MTDRAGVSLATRSMRFVTLALAVLALPATSGAQQPDTIPIAPATLPPDVAREVVQLFNATTALRATERVEIGPGREVRGNVAVLNGPLLLGGHVTGRVLAINSDVLLQPGAVIDGDLLVVGGEVDGREQAKIGGEVRIYHPPLRYTQEGDRLVAQAEERSPDDQWWRRFDRRGERSSNRLEDGDRGGLQPRRRIARTRGAGVVPRRGVGPSPAGRLRDSQDGEQLRIVAGRRRTRAAR
jgi:hypothetical protein